MKKWEYKVGLSRTYEISAKELNRFGKDGWQLVSSQRAEDGLCLVFKRPLKTKKLDTK